ncbi:oxygen-independent coproporphyrinogen III oxidase [Nitratireductor pacificus]|uniref:Coproporphyrinogen-III oxidase n=1 Tax=Nitratireductor pacificus pht-3B TaxID=391937 RepID=K2M640_9HYPH|nr:oxygen-independent coproporphyrinogen III oxidase [Nitratireductor pacificus]EKF17586.1 coproporphyrinogen III oxidase [Nitratireductor pacificus pht-3B]
MQRAGEQISGTGAASRYSEAVPRYTSYPTAPHFHAGVTGATFRHWLRQTGTDDDLSLYVHIPFCDRLCWFCACHTKMTQRYEPVAAFLDALLCEIRRVGAVLGGNGRVRALHFGGGSPTILRPDDVMRLGDALRAAFRFARDTEISVELDPNDMDEARFDAFTAIGMTRASLGVQDFDPRVQKAINREQTFAQTKAVVDGVRSRGVQSVNLDLLYGLPHQTLESVAATIHQALTLSPDRIALFGYAHVPWFKKHQTMIADDWLPGPEERYAQQQETARIIRAAGYEPIGLDHFARPGDPLAAAAREGRLFRNFQGYTEDACRTLIGLGPSSVSRLPQGYAQNTPATAGYERIVRDGGLATARGIALTDEDRARAWVIERLMCDFAFSGQEAIRLFGEDGARIVAEARAAGCGAGEQMLVERDGAFVVPEASRALVRTAAARFDQYLAQGGARHSMAV